MFLTLQKKQKWKLTFCVSDLSYLVNQLVRPHTYLQPLGKVPPGWEHDGILIIFCPILEDVTWYIMIKETSLWRPPQGTLLVPWPQFGSTAQQGTSHPLRAEATGDLSTPKCQIQEPAVAWLHGCSLFPKPEKWRKSPSYVFFLLGQLCDHKQGSGLKLCYKLKWRLGVCLFVPRRSYKLMRHLINSVTACQRWNAFGSKRSLAELSLRQPAAAAQRLRRGS